MSVLVDEETSVVVQGITGREAAETVPEMLAYGTDVAAGVTPGKGGEEVAGVPVYDTVADAVEAHPRIDASLVYVPPFAAKDAAFEAMASGVDVVNLITERVPVRDAHAIHERAERTGTRVVGPTSVGVISPGKCKLGPIGGDDPESVYRPGRVGVVSKSGGMTTETAWVIRQAGFGVSTAAGLGGDVIAGTTFADALELFEDDDQTDAVVLFGELGGTYEQQAAATVERGAFTKPLVAFVAGHFTEGLPEGQYGHAGAIVREERDTPTAKAERLREAGARVVDSHHRIAAELEAVL
jgi:succinyl-CoA synthetase alpha subunit